MNNFYQPLPIIFSFTMGIRPHIFREKVIGWRQGPSPTLKNLETHISQTVNGVDVQFKKVIGNDISGCWVWVHCTKSFNHGSFFNSCTISKQLAHGYENPACFHGVPHKPAGEDSFMYQLSALSW